MGSSKKSLSPAEKASEKALASIFKCLKNRQSFLLEAGAGAGKTYSLIETLKYLIENEGSDLLANQQQIACITYTNVAADEIISRTDSHPVIYSSTIHHFCWAMIQDFQSYLRLNVSKINDKWCEKIEEADGVKEQKVVYDLGYRRINDKQITLHHDDVLSFMTLLLSELKFQNLFQQRYPILFIDEYQDTEKKFIEALKSNFLDNNTGPLIGFFGDNWQKIYGQGCGEIKHKNLKKITKQANFRSAPLIVNVLNQIRKDLPQQVRDPEAFGEVSVFHTNNWRGERQKGSHWNDDLPREISSRYLENVKSSLKDNNWDFSPNKTKILMLTHNVLAEEQGYSNLLKVFSYNDSVLKKENPYIAFMVDLLEPLCDAYEKKCYGKMFSLLGRRTPSLTSHIDKQNWENDMNTLLSLREKGTIGDVLNHLLDKKRPRLPENMERKEQEFKEWLNQDEEMREKSRSLNELKELRDINYSELIKLSDFLNNSTPFNTKHGVKGAEFENVLIVLGRGWNHYNFGDLLEWASGVVPKDKKGAFEKNRNLFYVACSRPKKRLSLLFTQKLSDNALSTLQKWFGLDAVQALPGELS